MTPDTMRDVLAVRERVFREEMLTCGVPEANVQEHTKGWDEASAAQVVEDWTSWLNRPEDYFLRRVVLGEANVGLLIATLSSIEFPGEKTLSVIQLDRHVQGLGVGRSLVKELVESGDPAQKVYLRVFAKNESALGFYNHIGFSDTGRTGAENIGGYAVETKLLVKE